MQTKEQQKQLVLAIRFEEAQHFLAEHFPLPEETNRKPILFHDTRVGVYLYDRGYSAEIVLAGLLHDVIEWTDATEEKVQERFGNHITELVLANTKDNTIKDNHDKTTELIKRCVNAGQDALIIKAADIIDSFKWYEIQKNQEQLDGHCTNNAKAIFKYKPNIFNDSIFDELKKWKNKYN